MHVTETMESFFFFIIDVRRLNPFSVVGRKEKGIHIIDVMGSNPLNMCVIGKREMSSHHRRKKIQSFK